MNWTNLTTGSSGLSNSVAITRFVIQCLYILAGTACIFSNLLVIVVIGRTRKLHGKIFLLLVSLAVADVFKGVAYLIAGSKRLHLLIAGGMDALVTSFDCMREFATTVFILGPQAINLMTILVTLDRFIAIAFPLLYSTLRKSYALVSIATCWTLVLTSYIAAWIESSRLPRVARFSRWCIASWSFSTEYNRFMFGFEATSTWVCFVLLMVTMAAVKCPRSTNLAVVGRPSYYRRQLKVARMVLISLSFVVILWVVPTNIVFVMTLIGRTRAFDVYMAPALWLMVAFSGCTNVFVYAWLNKRIRDGIKALFIRCGKRDYVSVDMEKLHKPRLLSPDNNGMDMLLKPMPASTGRSSSNYQDM